MTRNGLERRGERLVRLAYDLEKMAGEARQHKDQLHIAASLRAAAKETRAAGDAYLNLAGSATR